MTQISIHPLYKRIPQEVVEAVKGHRYYSVNSSAILIQSDRTPRQNQNRDDCWEMFSEMLQEVGT